MSVKDVPEFVRSVDAEELIFHSGDHGEEMFIIQDGEIEIFQQDTDEEVQLAVLRQGDFFGEMAILEHQPRTASARALTPATLLPIRGATFDDMLQRNPEVAVRMVRKLSGRLMQMERQVRDYMDARDADDEQATAPADGEVDAADSGTRPNPRLEHERSDHVFPIAVEGETTLGRPDAATGMVPQIDLTPVNEARTISRRHARLIGQGGSYHVLEEIGTTNGVTVNGQRVGGGEQVEIFDGDTIAFGGVTTIFRV